MSHPTPSHERENELDHDFLDGWAENIMASVLRPAQIHYQPKGRLFGPRSEQHPI